MQKNRLDKNLQTKRRALASIFVKRFSLAESLVEKKPD